MPLISLQTFNTGILSEEMSGDIYLNQTQMCGRNENGKKLSNLQTFNTGILSEEMSSDIYLNQTQMCRRNENGKKLSNLSPFIKPPVLRYRVMSVVTFNSHSKSLHKGITYHYLW